MENNTLEDYKIGVKAKYEIEKRGAYSSFLIGPSRARLRSLCLEIFKSGQDQNDLNVFSSFFKFDYTPSCSSKLKGQTDKFRPIETFFKGETDLTDIEAVNIAAILVDFTPRPYLKFSKQQAFKKEKPPITSIENIDTADVFGVSTIVKGIGIIADQSIQPSTLAKKELRIFHKRLVIPGLIVFVMLSGFGYVLLPKKECMQWQKDHYEAVDCETKSVDILNLYSTMPLNKNMLNFRKIKICDTTTFFKNNKPILWYCKTENHLDFFNGPGLNPENEKPLKPITQYMINKYIK